MNKPPQNTNKGLKITRLLILPLAIGAGSLWLLNNSVDDDSAVSTLKAQQENAQALTVDIPTIDGKQRVHEVNGESFEEMLAAEIVRKYGERISEPAVQASLFKVQGFVLSKYPENGRDRFVTTINIAFPQYAEAILKLVLLMEQYDDWLAENYTQLNAMAPLERDGTLWDKRRALFGSVADQIWVEEKALLATKQREIQEIFYQLDNAEFMSLDEKLYQLQTGLNETLGDTVQNVAINNEMVAQVFFSLDSVQATLQGMGAEQRLMKLKAVREQLGFNAEQIARMTADDAKRNARWENGAAYLQKRAELMSELEQDQEALDDALALVRLKYFEHEAETIAMEEASGFSRYERPRVYGRN